MYRNREPGFETLKALCKRAVRGDAAALSELTVWVQEVGGRASIGDRWAKRELEELAYAVAYDFVEERIRRGFIVDPENRTTG